MATKSILKLKTTDTSSPQKSKKAKNVRFDLFSTTIKRFDSKDEPITISNENSPIMSPILFPVRTNHLRRGDEYGYYSSGDGNGEDDDESCWFNNLSVLPNLVKFDKKFNNIYKKSKLLNHNSSNHHNTPLELESFYRENDLSLSDFDLDDDDDDDDDDGRNLGVEGKLAHLGLYLVGWNCLFLLEYYHLQLHLHYEYIYHYYQKRLVCYQKPVVVVSRWSSNSVLPGCMSSHHLVSLRAENFPRKHTHQKMDSMAQMEIKYWMRSSFLYQWCMFDTPIFLCCRVHPSQYHHQIAFSFHHLCLRLVQKDSTAKFCFDFYSLYSFLF